VHDPINVVFLTNAEEQLYKTLIAAGSEAEEASCEKLANSSWTGNLPWLRLYCSMVHDDARKLIPTKDLTMTRDELDASSGIHQCLRSTALSCFRFVVPVTLASLIGLTAPATTACAALCPTSTTVP
jgi:hypothetical protein